MSTIAAVIGRILLAIIFIMSGLGKLFDPLTTAGMLDAAGLSPGLAVPVGAFELLAGVALALGLMTRLVAVLLFVYTGLAILFFHNRFTDPFQLNQAFKNLAIMGGLLLVFAHSQMWWSWDRMRRDRRSALAVRDAERRGDDAVLAAERRAHEAELRAARAEGLAEGTHSIPVDERRVVRDVRDDGVHPPRRRRWWR